MSFGVLPPVSILTPEQTQYYFLSGFTAKLAGTERGITEPTPTFSACFGQAFLELHPTKYAQELVKKMKANNAKAYLVNTGWNGTGKRISINDTRGIIDAILSGAVNEAPTKKIPMFDFEVPTELPGVDPKILDLADCGRYRILLYDHRAPAQASSHTGKASPKRRSLLLNTRLAIGDQHSALRPLLGRDEQLCGYLRQRGVRYHQRHRRLFRAALHRAGRIPALWGEVTA